MVTAAPARRLANTLVALAIVGPAAMLGGVAWADPTPTPAADASAADNGSSAETATEAPVPQPSGSWISGGTLLEGAGKPAAKPVAQPAAPAATVQVSSEGRTASRTSSRATPRTTTRVITRATSRRTTRVASSTIGAATAPDGAVALPFTGGHVDALLPVGSAMLLLGVALTFASRPRRVLI